MRMATSLVSMALQATKATSLCLAYALEAHYILCKKTLNCMPCSRDIHQRLSETTTGQCRPSNIRYDTLPKLGTPFVQKASIESRHVT